MGGGAFGGHHVAGVELEQATIDMMAITFIAPPNDRSPIHLAPYKLPK